MIDIEVKNAISLKVFGAALDPPRLLVKISRSGVDRPHHRGLVSVGTVTPTPSHLLSTILTQILGFWHPSYLDFGEAFFGNKAHPSYAGLPQFLGRTCTMVW